VTGNQDISGRLAEAVQSAAAARSPLTLRGNGTKRFLTGEGAGTPLDVSAHRGIVSYEPTELVITARAGTPLAEIENALAGRGQMLGFEPPHFGDATLGGTIACGLSGPRRPYAGAARDFVLGATIINGRGEVLHFGGQVMKNVAGFDVSRLMAGAYGTLGVLLEVSLKVVPRPAAEMTLRFALPTDRAIAFIGNWASQPLPISGACHSGDSLYLRLSGTDIGIRAAQTRLGGEAVEDGGTFWRDLREQTLAFFQDAAPLWRLSVPAATAPIALPGGWLIDWGGAQRWLKTDAPTADIQRVATDAGGYAMPFRGLAHDPGARPALAPALATLQRKLRAAFDPYHILNSSCPI
jgi:glycolate oxidase FAD binding subunit